MEEVRTNKMGTEPILKLLVKMALPVMFSMLVISLYNIIDSYFVSLISEKAFRAVSLSFPIQQIILAVSLGIGMGINSLASRRLGQNRISEANNVVAHGVFLSIIFSIGFIIFGLFFGDYIFNFFTEDAEVHRMGVSYLKIVTVFSIISIIQITQEKSIQSTGNMIIPMISQITGAVLNIILDPILIFGLFGAPELGVRGAAIATMISQFMAALILILYLKFSKGELTLDFKDFKFEMKTFEEIMEVGFPTMIMQAIPAFLTMSLNRIIMPLSEVGVSVLGLYYKLQSFVFMPSFGLTQSVLPIIGYNYGARRKSRIDQTLKYGFVIITGVMFLGMLLFQFKAEELINIFNSTPEMVELGIPALKTISISFVPAALVILSATFFQALGYGKYSLLVSVLRQLVIILPLAKFLSLRGISYIWWAYPIAEVIAFVISIILVKSVYEREILELERVNKI